MRKALVIFLLLIVAASVEGALKNWTNNGSPVNFNWSRGTGSQDNWSTTGIPLITDTANLAGTSAVRCSCNVPPTVCAKLNVNSGYGFRWTWNTGIAFHYVKSFNDLGTSSRLWRDSLVHEGTGLTTWGSGLGTVDATGLNYRIMGVDTTADNKGLTIENLEIDASASMRLSGSAVTTIAGACPLLTLGNSAIFSNGSGGALALKPTNAGTMISLGTTPTLGGSRGFTFYVAAADTIPAITYAGTGGTGWHVTNSSPAASGSVDLSGAVNIGQIDSFHVENESSTATRSLAFRTNNNNLTCGDFSWGSDGTQSTSVSVGSSTINCLSYGMEVHNNATASQTIDLGTSTWNDSTNWIEQNHHVVTKGTSQINFLGSRVSAIQLDGQPVYNVTMNKSVSGTRCTTQTNASGDTMNNLVLTAGYWKTSNVTVLRSYTNNLSAAGDTAVWRGRKFISVDLTRGAGSHALVDSPTVFIGATESDVTTSGFSLYQVYLRKSKATGVFKLMDDMTTHRFVQDSGIFTQNKKVLTDSVHIIKDSTRFDTTIIVYAKDSTAATARGAGLTGGSKIWAGGVTCDVWSSGKMRAPSHVAKTPGSSVVSHDPLRTRQLYVSTGGFQSLDTVYADTLIDTTSDSTTFHVIRLTGKNPLLVFGPNARPGFSAGALIIVDSCYATITNSSGHALPSIAYTNCAALSITGDAASGSATASGNIAEIDGIFGSALSQAATSSGNASLTIVLSGSAASDAATVSGNIAAIASVSGDATSGSATATGTIAVFPVATAVRNKKFGFDMGFGF